ARFSVPSSSSAAAVAVAAATGAVVAGGGAESSAAWAGPADGRTRNTQKMKRGGVLDMSCGFQWENTEQGLFWLNLQNTTESSYLARKALTPLDRNDYVSSEI